MQETDISKIGAIADSFPDKERRNTCPNAGAYRPIIHREAIGRFLNNNNTGGSIIRSPLAVKFARSARNFNLNAMNIRTNKLESNEARPKKNCAVQTEISLSTLPELSDHWRSESHLLTGFKNGFYTLPSKFIPTIGVNICKHPLK